MLIKDYFQDVESQIALCPGVVEYQVTPNVAKVEDAADLRRQG